jgi:hypothetical protein
MASQPQTDELSPDAVRELSQDHLSDNEPPDPSSYPITFASEDPASTATALGTAILATAIDYLKMPLREDAGVNNDKHGYIRTFFLEGLKWSPDTWDHWAEKYPQTQLQKPEWCAAFASYCARKAYTADGRKLPATPSGSASDMATRFGTAKRLLTHEALFQSDGKLKEGVQPPGPGDLVVWHGHVGVLKDIYPSGAFTTIEGNTWRGSPRNDGVYQCSRNSLEKRADGTFKLVGFCLLASLDGTPTQVAVPTPVQGSPSDPKQAAPKTQGAASDTDEPPPAPLLTDASPSDPKQAAAKTQGAASDADEPPPAPLLTDASSST